MMIRQREEMRVKSVLGIVFSFYLLMMIGITQSAYAMYSYESTVLSPGALAAGVEVDSSGNIYVSKHTDQKVQKYDSNGNFLMDFNVGVGAPHNSAVDSAGNLYVATFGDSVIKFDPAGTAILTFGSGAGANAGQLGTAHSVAIHPTNGNVYVTENANHRVSVFLPDGTFDHAFGFDVDPAGGTGYETCNSVTTCKIGVQGPGSGQFDGPTGVAFDSSENLYIADWANHRIQRFLAAGGIQQLGSGVLGDSPSQFQNPTDVTVDTAGNVFVADFGNHKVKIYDSGFLHLQTLGSTQGNGNNQFSNPHGVATFGSKLYVADWANDRVQIFNSNILTGSVTIDPVCEIDMASGSLNFNPGNPIDHGADSQGTGEISEVLSNTLGNLNSNVSVYGTDWTNPAGTLTIMDVSHTHVSTVGGELFDDMDALPDSATPLALGAIGPQSSMTTYWNVEIVMDGGNPGYSGATVQTITVDFSCT